MIQAIQTRFKGHHMRSRTEARWAVYLDEMKVGWRYEPEGYELPDGRYLPDFLLLGDDVFMEVKGQDPTSEERRKCRQLAIASGKAVILFIGTPGESERCFLWAWVKTADGLKFLRMDEPNVAPWYLWLVDADGIASLAIAWPFVKDAIVYRDAAATKPFANSKSYYNTRARIAKAEEAARSARFEFGESGPT